MDEQSIFINANLASLRAQVDAIVSTLNEESKNKYEKQIVDSIQNILEKYESKFDQQSFIVFQNLVKEMSLRD